MGEIISKLRPVAHQNHESESILARDGLSDKSTPYVSVSGNENGYLPYVEIENHGSTVCPTCQGTGRIPKDQEKELVALIPYSDQRLQPRQTKLYVSLAVVICLLLSSLAIFFLFPRSIVVTHAGLNSSVVTLATSSQSINLSTTNVLNISNGNFHGIGVTQLDVEVLLVATVIGKSSTSNVTSVGPLGTSQIYYTVNSTIKDNTTYNICTWPIIKVHNVLLHIQGTLTCSSLGHSEQLSFDGYQYVDCRSNTTIPHSLHQLR
ncbi:transmembrane protein 106A [Microcaecilia unicolor]|uniref:Transmembrane protein 106A-like n=1 Tax=Microcaecilia unicolor TaxID=1415580 RepID=A0A6P7ZW61_9AMPH|nr:transmembrane protein 106A-like [Microcaecilia unicolor]XP_030077593.1 transmembrane protein 106A-like [Microcaecilia unicolor]XP_030077594.1 transmembrane protein 106A-like [Microcaecilia unicolor]XP_030077595.1 transmembrane protein 106A-like [Microcaecilia unicolor]